MRCFKSLSFVCYTLSSAAFAQYEDVPYLRMVTNGYAVVASHSIDVTLVPMTESQLSLSPHLLIETDLLVEQIQVRYIEKGEVLQRAILLTQQGASPYVRFGVIKREALENAEIITFKMETNVPDRVIAGSTVRVNGQPVELKPGGIYTFTAYQAETVIEGVINISNATEPATGVTRLHHAIMPDVGCELIDEKGRFYALCYANEAGEQSVQFYLKQQPIGQNGETSYIDAMVPDLKLTYRVGLSKYDFKIVEGESGYSFTRVN